MYWAVIVGPPGVAGPRIRQDPKAIVVAGSVMLERSFSPLHI